jgi:hypothetical protein
MHRPEASIMLASAIFFIVWGDRVSRTTAL